jgi:2-haloacid dehalogenase
MQLEALAFDTGGTVLDWHGSLLAQARRRGAAQGTDVDWHAFVNTWRRAGWGCRRRRSCWWPATSSI